MRPPEAVQEALELVQRFDRCLELGFTRLGESERASLSELNQAFVGSPLEQAITEAVEAVARTEFLPSHFLTLAAARVSLMGAIHDALWQQAHEYLGRDLPPDPSPIPSQPLGPAAGLLNSASQWLMELALYGFYHLDESAVAPFSATLEPLLADPELVGLNALLSGFHQELLVHMPASRQPSLPIFRWADLWSAAFVATRERPGESTFESVEGVFTPLGLDSKEHDLFVCHSLYGVFKGQAVRVPFSSFKVGVISGPETWDLFDSEVSDAVLSSLEQHSRLQVRAELRPNGDLVLTQPPEMAGSSDLAELTLPGTVRVSARQRHPVHLAIPLRLEAEHEFPLVHVDPIFDDKARKKMTAQLGLLRFDAGAWGFQPLCWLTKKDFIMRGEDVLKARKKLKNPCLDILRERASRLLRA